MTYALISIFVVVYFVSLEGVALIFKERDVDLDLFSFLVILLPIINTFYWIIFGFDLKKTKKNLRKMFNKKR